MVPSVRRDVGLAVRVTTGDDVGVPDSNRDRDGQRVSVRVTDALYEALQAAADADRRSLSNLVTLLLEDGLRARGALPKSVPMKKPRSPTK